MQLADLLYGENYKEEIDLKHKLEDKICKNLGLPKKHVLLNYGANSNLLLFFSAYSAEFLYKKKRRVKVLIDLPNYFFTQHQIKHWYVNPIYIQRDNNFDLSIPDFVKNIKEKNPDIIVVTTPNNPTGKPIKNEDLALILNSASKEQIVFIDRSCLNTVPEISTKEIFKKFPNKNIVVLKSFSKSHSMSDKRMGYLATNREEIAKLVFIKADLNHNLSALKYLENIIDDKKYVSGKKQILKDCHKILKSSFSKNKEIIFYDSKSNFALVKLPPHLNSIIVEQEMIKNNVLVMGGHRIGLGDKFIRIHMSGVKEITKFVEILMVL